MENKSKKKTIIIIIAAVLVAAIFAAVTVIVLKSVGGNDQQTPPVSKEITVDERQTSMACANIYMDELKDENNTSSNNTTEDWRKIDVDYGQYGTARIKTLYVNYFNPINGVIFVTEELSIAQDDTLSWQTADNKWQLLWYLQNADPSVKTVVYLIGDESGKINGVSYRIEDVFNGYKDGTWSFDNAKSDYEINAAKHK